MNAPHPIGQGVTLMLGGAVRLFNKRVSHILFDLGGLSKLISSSTQNTANFGIIRILI
jgi:hypothetical protein